MMLPPEPAVIAGRQCLEDSQAQFAGALTPIGNFYASWYGTSIQDERGFFAVVNPATGLANAVGDFLAVNWAGRSVIVYVVGSYTLLTTDIGLSRRAYLSIARPSLDPILAPVELVS